MKRFENQIEKALFIALTAHSGQVDKAGKPYILHPLTVAMMQNTEEEFIAGLLHDVVEDSDVTLEYLEEQGFSKEILEAVRLLTHEEGEDYLEYVKKIRGNKIATRVKIADLKHNSDLGRFSEVTEKDILRLERKYKPAYHILTGQSWGRY